MASFWCPPDRRPIYDWAHDHVDLPSAVTIRGRFDVSRSRRLIAPFDALHSDHVREENVLAPPRGGKSLIADIYTAWAIVNDPGPLMWNFQKDQTADDHCETRLWPTLLGCAPVRALLESIGRHQKRTSEIIMPDMFVIVQGPALSNLQSKGCRYLINDEIWQYPPGRVAEAYSRVDDFVKMGISKIFNLSQAGELNSEWFEKWEGSSRHVWWIVCQKCGKAQYPVWSGKRTDGTRYGMRWDEHRLANGDWHLTRALETVRWECRECGHPHIDGARLKNEWNRTGRYEQTNTDARPARLGHHWNAIVDYPWADLAERFMRAADARRRGVLLPLIQFHQKELAQFMDESRLLEQTAQLPVATYDVKGDWPAEHARFFTVDRQAEDTYWGTVRAWSKAGESRRLWFGKLLGAGEIEAKRIEFKVKPSCTFVDSGHEAKGDFGVYSLCAKYGWIATKGAPQRQFTNVRTIAGKRVLMQCAYKDPQPVSPAVGSRLKCFLFVFSADEMKDRMSNLIKTGTWKEPATPEGNELEHEYAMQMSSEFKKPKKDKFTGRWTMVWVCPSGNNHAHDCGALQCLAATILEILPDYEREKK